jgi:hypothetical protein
MNENQVGQLKPRGYYPAAAAGLTAEYRNNEAATTHNAPLLLHHFNEKLNINERHSNCKKKEQTNGNRAIAASTSFIWAPLLKNIDRSDVQHAAAALDSLSRLQQWQHCCQWHAAADD